MPSFFFPLNRVNSKNLEGKIFFMNNGKCLSVDTYSNNSLSIKMVLRVSWARKKTL